MIFVQSTNERVYVITTNEREKVQMRERERESRVE